MTIKDFLTNFTYCPWCNNKLSLSVPFHKDFEPEPFIKESKQKIVVNFKTNYFIEVDKSLFHFSITLSKNAITASPEAFQFYNMYHIPFHITKRCIFCKTNRFLRELDISYNRANSVFEAKIGHEEFSFHHEDIPYRFCNNIRNNQSFIATQFPYTQTKVPFVPLNNFVFNNRLSNQLDSIRLLV